MRTGINGNNSAPAVKIENKYDTTIQVRCWHQNAVKEGGISLRGKNASFVLKRFLTDQHVVNMIQSVTARLANNGDRIPNTVCQKKIVYVIKTRIHNFLIQCLLPRKNYNVNLYYIWNEGS